MLTVSLFVELLRTWPRLLVWAMIAIQVVLWTLVPTLFYAASPGQLAELLAVGREFQLGSEFGPPLAYWLAAIAFSVAGMFGVYLLSQLCMAVTYLAVFNLGRVVVGEPQAAVAVLLMAGVGVFTLPTAEFSPAILAAPLWALMLLHFWQAIGQGRRTAWFLLSIETGLLLLTTYAGLILFGLIVVFMVATERGREQLSAKVEPWIAGIVAVVVVFPHLIWLDQSGSVGAAGLAAIQENLGAWAWLLATLFVGHVGFVLLAALGYGMPVSRTRPAPEIGRLSVDPLARRYVYFFACAPAAAIGLCIFFAHRAENFMTAPLVVLSGLALVVAAGDRIRIVHQHIVGYAWAALLVVPPLAVALAVPLLPWTLASDLRVGQPAAEMGRFFAEQFQRRTGRPLQIVAGDQRTAALVALTAPSKPSLYFDAAPRLSPWVVQRDIEQKGAVVVWPTADTSGTPPAAIRQRFPDLAPEVPRAFERRFQGRMSLLRIGWGVIRPRAPAAQ